MAVDDDADLLLALGLREKQVLRAMADGLTLKQIAVERGVAVSTVRHIVSDVNSKLDCERDSYRSVGLLLRTENEALRECIRVAAPTLSEALDPAPVV